MSYLDRVFENESEVVDVPNVVNFQSGIQVNGTALSVAEMSVVDGVTAGTVTASKALVVDSNKDLGDLRNLGCTNLDAGASGTAGTVDIFPTTASKGKLSLTCTDQTGNTTVTLNANAMGQATTVNVADPGAAASYVVQSTAAVTLAEADVLDGATAGTQVASKVVVADENVNIGVVKATELHIGTSGSETQVTATAAELNKCDGIATAAYQTVMSEVLFTEDGAGTYTGTITLPAGSRIVDIGVDGIALWDAATSASMEVGDATDPDGFFTATDLKATDLLAGEINNLEHPGGKAGAYIASEQRVLYNSAERVISGVVTSVGAGTAGRTRMYVVYATPTATNATKA